MTAIQEVPPRADRRVKVKPATTRACVPTVSVVISCFNYARYLPMAVESCVTQQDVAVEVIIVDDASTDDSLSVARGLGREHANVLVVSHTRNTGPVEAFNDGARIATGEFLVRLDADDLLTPGSLGRATLVAQSFPSVGLVYGHPLHFSGEALPTPRLSPTAWTVWPGPDWLARRCQSGKNVITSPEVLMRRSLAAKLGYLSPLAHSHDMELWLRLAAFGDVAYIHGADQAWHREHSESLSAKAVDELVDFRERVAAFDVLFRGPAAALPEASHLRGVAERTLAREALRTARHELALGPERMALCSAWLEMARTMDPAITGSGEWARLHRPPRLGALTMQRRFSSLAYRLRGRIRSELEWHRWHHTGVY